MIPYKFNRPTAVPRTLEVRFELMKAIRSLTAPDQVQKFDPNQPRVPAGNADSGQWTSEGDRGLGHGAINLAARRISPALLAECEQQYERDLEECRMVGLSTCYQQALLRRANCERGLQIPPLNY
jgi:hypothetical protein